MLNIRQSLTIVALVGLSGLGLAQIAPSTTPKPTMIQPQTGDSDVRQRIDAFAAAWNKHDPTAMAAFWATTGDLINPFGRIAKGREQVLKLFQDEHAGFAKTSTFKITDQSLRMLKPDVSIADADVTITGVTSVDGSMQSPMKNHVTFVLTKDGGQWMFAAVRPVVYAPAPGEQAVR